MVAGGQTFSAIPSDPAGWDLLGETTRTAGHRGPLQLREGRHKPARQTRAAGRTTSLPKTTKYSLSLRQAWMPPEAGH